MTRAAVLVLLAAACTRDAAPRPPVDNRGGAVATDAGPDAASAAACVEACVRDRQMVATSIEAIRAGCERDCAAPTP